MLNPGFHSNCIEKRQVALNNRKRRMWIFQGQFVRKRMGDGVEKEGRLGQKRYQDCGSPALSLSIYISIYLSISVYLHTHTHTVSQRHSEIEYGWKVTKIWVHNLIWYKTNLQKQIKKSFDQGDRTWWRFGLPRLRMYLEEVLWTPEAKLLEFGSRSISRC